jgi:hypothetical protein
MSRLVKASWERTPFPCRRVMRSMPVPLPSVTLAERFQRKDAHRDTFVGQSSAATRSTLHVGRTKSVIWKGHEAVLARRVIIFKSLRTTFRPVRKRIRATWDHFGGILTLINE